MDYACFGEEELSNLQQVIESQELWRATGGRFTARFEDAFKDHLGRRYVLGVSSGTCANETALAGLGLKPGDEVICPAAAPIFVSLPVVGLGCVPVFAEVDPRTLILSPEGIEQRVTSRTRAVVVVHLHGQPAPLGDILAVTRKHGLQVLEDCSQSYDAWYQGKKVGTLGEVACFSLQQSKHITTGEGGLVATDDPDTYKRAVLFANCGMPWFRYGLEPPTAEPVAGLPTRGHFAFGHNYRMSELQAAVGLAQLEKMDTFNTRRREFAALVAEELEGADGVELPYVYPDTIPNYWQYPVRVPRPFGTYRELNYLEEVYRRMERDRRTSVGWPLPEYVHYKPGICPQTEAAAPHFRTLNVHPSTDAARVREAARGLRNALEAAGRGDA